MNLFLTVSHNAMHSFHGFEAAVRKQTNAVQHLSPLSRTALNFLVSESFPWLSGVLKWFVESLPMILLILLAFNTSLHNASNSASLKKMLSLFHRHAGLRCQNHRS